MAEKPVKYLFEYWLFAGTAFVLQRLPLRTVRWVANAVGTFVFYFVPIRRALTIEQLTLAFPDESPSKIRLWARESYVNLVTTIFEMMWLPRVKKEDWPALLRVVNPDLLADGLERRKGLIMMSGHFANWEWLCIGTAVQMDHYITSIVHPMHNPRVDHLVQHYRSIHGNRVVPMGAAVREIMHALRERRTVALLADQSGPDGAYYVRLFGRWAATYEGPAQFALRSRTPIIIGFAVRRPDGGYDAEYEEIDITDLTDGGEEDMRELTRRHVRCLERAIRNNPGQWLWQHKRWKHEPGPDSILIEDPEGG